MANAIYPSFKASLLKGDIDFDTADVKAILVDLADYTYSSAHDFLADVAGGAIVATFDPGSTTTTGGVLDMADSSATSVTGDQSEAIIFYIDTGNSATSPLICFFDTGVTGLPLTPDGNNVNLIINASGLLT